jgi:hypothetical protein
MVMRNGPDGKCGAPRCIVVDRVKQVDEQRWHIRQRDPYHGTCLTVRHSELDFWAHSGSTQASCITVTHLRRKGEIDETRDAVVAAD